MISSSKQTFVILCLLAVAVFITFQVFQSEFVKNTMVITNHKVSNSDFDEHKVISRSDKYKRTEPVKVQLNDSVETIEFYSLPDIQSDENELHSEKNIFFILSTITENGIACLTLRQTCAIESTARANRDWKVFVLFSSATVFHTGKSSNIILLLAHSNIHLRRIDPDTYAIGTPLEEFFKHGTLKTSNYIVEHTSDVLRFITLYKYGGTYLDTDVIVMKSLNELPHNYLGDEGDGYVGSAVINLQSTGYGHSFAEACLIDIAANYNGSVWAANGPFLVTRILQRFCNVTDTWDMTREQCGGQLSVLDPEAFFLYAYPEHTRLFEEEYTKDVLKELEGKVLIHLWNKLTGSIVLKKDSKAAYIALAERYCPDVMRTCDEYF